MTLSFEINHERQAGLTGTPAENVMGCNEYILTWQPTTKYAKKKNLAVDTLLLNRNLVALVDTSYIAFEDGLEDFRRPFWSDGV